MAREMVAKERTASKGTYQSANETNKRMEVGRGRRTHDRHNLRLEPILVAEPASNVTDSTLVVLGNIRYLADVVEHVAGDE